MKYDFITIGGSVIDETFKTDEGDFVDNPRNILKSQLIGFEYGAKISIFDYHPYFGGGAANAAVSLSRLGYRTAILTKIGNDDRGRNILENLKKEKVSTKLVRVSRELATGFSFVVVTKEGEKIAFTHRGANNALEINSFEKKALDQAKWLYVASLSGQWEQVLDKVFSVVGARFVWNPGNIQIEAGLKKISKYLKKTDVFILNKSEAVKLAVYSGKMSVKNKASLKKIEILLKMINALGPSLSVITCGEEGAYAYDGKKIYFQKSVKVNKVADTTGVGDAFSSALVAGLEYYDYNIQKAMRLGIRNAAYILRKPGAQNGLFKV